MRKIFIRSVSTAVILSCSLFAITGPHASIVSSPTSNGANGEICVYCHTPHNANSDDFGPTPLWNKPTPTTTFRMYGASDPGIAGETIAGTFSDAQPSDQSLACLSCHDGVSAMNSVINAPGSGNVGGGTLAADGTIYIADNTAITMPKDQFKAIGAPLPLTISGSIITYGDYGALENDHPVSIPYMPGRASLKEITAPLVNFFGATSVAQLLREGDDGIKKVHCVSCHDPHGTGNPRYLRTENIGSSLCLGCHDK